MLSDARWLTLSRFRSAIHTGVLGSLTPREVPFVDAAANLLVRDKSHQHGQSGHTDGVPPAPALGDEHRTGRSPSLERGTTISGGGGGAWDAERDAAGPGR